MVCLRPLFLLLLLAFGAPPTNGQQACVFNGINAASFGVNTRQTALAIQWNAGTCSIETTVTAPVCCGAILAGHALVLGEAPIPVPVLLAEPFFPGSYLYVLPDFIIGPVSTNVASYVMPPDPSLAGKAFFVQGVAVVFDPIRKSTELGISQGMIAQLLL